MKKISDWAPNTDEIERLVNEDAITKGSPLKACGCGVKLDLEEVVYPVLSEFIRDTNQSGYGVRVDAAAVRGTLKFKNRRVIKINDAKEIQESVATQPQILAALVSMTPRFYSLPDQARIQFRKSAEIISNIVNSPSSNVQFGKAHSIEGDGDYIALDFFDISPGEKVVTHLNHDSIITADSLLLPSSKISVFTSLNNALNDLFVCGVTDNINIFPTVDGTPSEVQKIQMHIENFKQVFSSRGVAITVHPLQPLNLGTSVVGATVSGTCEHHATQFSDLRAGDKIVVTRKLGDLSILALHRLLALKNLEISSELVQHRIRVLKKFMTPQFTIAKALQKYFRPIGAQFDSNKHISFVSDLSGPGLAVLEDAAVNSKKDVRISNLEFIDKGLLKHYRRNHTSSTNGPMLIAGNSKVVDQLCQELRECGLDEIWTLGSVLQDSKTPTLFFDKELKYLVDDENPRHDFFAPEVWFDHEKRRIPIFKSFNFLD